MILGPLGTRRGLSPPIPAGATESIDAERVDRWVSAAAGSGLERVALLCATREDLADGGVAWMEELLRRLRKAAPRVEVELHVGELGASVGHLRKLLRWGPKLVHHAVAASPRIYHKYFRGVEYVESLEILRMVKEDFDGIVSRATVALGFGETKDELVASLADLKSVRVDEVLLAQADAGSARPAPAKETIDRAMAVGRKLGFRRLECVDAPLSCAPPADINCGDPKDATKPAR